MHLLCSKKYAVVINLIKYFVDFGNYFFFFFDFFFKFVNILTQQSREIDNIVAYTKKNNNFDLVQKKSFPIHLQKNKGW